MATRRDRVDKYAQIMMAAWEKVEGESVSASYVATFADMARAVAEEADKEVEEARDEGYSRGLDDGYSDGKRDWIDYGS